METGEKGIELFASAPKPLPKISTHIEGLDQILEGGLPAQRTTLIMGEPGTEKQCWPSRSSIGELADKSQVSWSASRNPPRT
jgi:archaellum biogenesis ATPase FlaH